MPTRLIIFLLGAVLTLSTTVHAQSMKVPAKKWNKGYIPKGLPKIYFGMPLATFIAGQSDYEDVSDETYTFRRVLLQKFADKDYEAIVYYFDEDGDKPLYELLIIYPERVDVNRLARQYYGKPNKDDEWYWEHKNGYPVNIWVFKQKLVIAGVMPGTEWVD